MVANEIFEQPAVTLDDFQQAFMMSGVPENLLDQHGARVRLKGN
jgi:hypothetical protein